MPRSEIRSKQVPMMDSPTGDMQMEKGHSSSKGRRNQADKSSRYKVSHVILTTVPRGR